MNTHAPRVQFLIDAVYQALENLEAERKVLMQTLTVLHQEEEPGVTEEPDEPVSPSQETETRGRQTKTGIVLRFLHEADAGVTPTDIKEHLAYCGYPTSYQSVCNMLSKLKKNKRCVHNKAQHTYSARR